jgi:hypothetical protein
MANFQKNDHKNCLKYRWLLCQFANINAALPGSCSARGKRNEDDQARSVHDSFGRTKLFVIE